MEGKFHKSPGFSDKKSRGSTRTLSPAARERLMNMTSEEQKKYVEDVFTFRNKVREDCIKELRKDKEEG